jgi:hypothetical protein
LLQRLIRLFAILVAIPFKDPCKNLQRVIDPIPLHLLCKPALENPKRSKPCDVALAFSLSRHPKKFEARKQGDFESMDTLSLPLVPTTLFSLMLQIILVHQTLKKVP